MKKITSKKELLESVKDILAVEILARENYIEDIESFTDPDIKFTIEDIKKQEDHHIEMLNELIAMLEEKKLIVQPLNISSFFYSISMILLLFFTIFYSISLLNHENNTIVGDIVSDSTTNFSINNLTSILLIKIFISLFLAIVIFYLFNLIKTRFSKRKISKKK